MQKSIAYKGNGSLRKFMKKSESPSLAWNFLEKNFFIQFHDREKIKHLHILDQFRRTRFTKLYENTKILCTNLVWRSTFFKKQVHHIKMVSVQQSNDNPKHGQ